ncbi:predicted protein [Nematostella vectensis]|uniref:cGMP-dependent protein kinase interacting domain-containing protein n=1 Tax=Nematostella vectensis TaxID=45351 RepID=A7RXW0_NEMVE|nr:protein phosphatase 1 regulatory subunit 12B [Nematostella vectensis]EDO43692.1 predicted protein [Nematostella vectensis]|eukprot:XP_001635755.1 predicted protein [Nematostella vectensis]
MADLTEDGYTAEHSSKPRHRRDRTERRERKLKLAADNGDSPASTIENNSSYLEDSTTQNDNFLSPDRAEKEAPRKERRSRSKQKDEVEIKVTDEDGTEGAAASGESPARSKLKKERKTENSARKRQAKKNLREKRRSTGVVIMPHMESDDEGDDEKKALKAHTQKNEQLVPTNDEVVDDTATARSKSSNKRIEQKVVNDSETIEKQQLVERIEEYESQIDDFKSKLEKANKELDQLRLDNQRLKDENSALLRVVNQLSTMKGK